ncbi:glycoside hydrolase family 28 protein [Planctomonas sp. JC2975]|uniref:glycoside hydrolase family 28 protein n=1 Tax=Planctomonas sp. JC2975 TaxID=2729626 RepID=UPI001472BF12|nr:glycoside hydrolase family 28 protein [Planctomonas sp. JC2975]NNC12526.1 glycoside hydrolase family 28 protein [Planctomonas sp. JC2975]
MPKTLSRREALALGGASFLGAVTLLAVGSESAFGDVQHGSTPVTPWPEAEKIIASVKKPRIPGRTRSVTEFGGVGDGTTDNTEAFRAGISALSAKGGGRLTVPAGTYLTGAIHLESRIDLHVEEGARILFSTDPAAYLPVVLTRFGGEECMSFSPFIYAYGKTDIAITGTGVIDGQASTTAWWPYTGSTSWGWQPGMPTSDADGAALDAMAESGVPVAQRVFGDGHYMRPTLIQPYNCQRVLISGVTTHRTPNWQLNPVLCTDVTIENVTASSHGPNNDGCDPESCNRVLITGCTFDTGDDCIAIKAGKNADGRRVNVPSQNIVIQQCEFFDGHGAITIGSEMTGGVRNVYARDNRCDSKNLNEGIRLKTNSMRGGFITDVHVRNMTIEEVADAVLIVDFFYGEGAGHGFNPVVKNISLQDVRVGTASYPLYAVGYPDDLITNISLTNVLVDTAKRSSVSKYTDNVTFTNVWVNGQKTEPPKPFATLADAFNDIGTGTAASPGNLDGSGRYLTRDSLAAAGLTPGAAVTHGALTYTWPTAAAGSNDNVAAGDETILLSGSGSTLGLLGLATHGNQSGTLTVNYSDGTADTATVAFSDWWHPVPSAGDEPVAGAMSSDNHAVGIFSFGVPLAAGKTVASVELPANANIHVFDLAIG